MGVERIIRHPPDVTADWAAVRDRLTAAGETPVLRMIDGLPAFPDEVPADGWQELRVSLAGGMVTLRRRPAELVCVTWGNAGPDLAASWDAFCRACAEATGGAVLDD
jgi:hypothetical protein